LGRYLFLWLLLFGQLAFVSQSYSAPIALPKVKAKTTACRKLLWAAASLVALSVTPTVYHDVAGYVSGERHIGHGIYLDYEKALTKFSASEKATLESHGADPLEKVRIITQKLRGDYGSWIIYPFAAQSNASAFLDPQQKDRGVCRHKSCVLKAMLDEMNIRSELQCGNASGCPLRWHVWVYLPDYDMVADPTEGTLSPAKDYLARYRISLNEVPMPGGWY
jgi:hypothetical protein